MASDPDYIAAFNHQKDGYRRVVTGYDDKGKSIFISDERVKPVTFEHSGGGPYHRLWSADEPPVYPGDASDPKAKNFFPELRPGSTTQGHRMLVFEVPVGDGPGGTDAAPGADPAKAAAEMEDKVPGLAGHMEPDEPGMHATATIDMEIVLSGRIQLELDYGLKKVMTPGDVIIQNGTRHRWTNVGKVPAVVMAFIVGADHKLKKAH
ncbi:cupin 2, conserved barrel domain protein [Hyaloraphidium curvatum]|nr:cupin 2, conserved barrel domain protein [Hyaloraphidium curvatum]